MEIPADSVAFAGEARIDDRHSVYEAFAQDEYYMQAWQPLLSNARGGYQFNWAAAYCGMSWCFYRKMYGVGLLLFVGASAAILIAGLIALMLMPGIDAEKQAFTWWVTVLAVLAIRVPFGFFANRVYFRSATRAIEKARTQGLSVDQLLVRLRDCGGTSAIGLGVAIAINLAFRLLSQVIHV